ncbi:MAG: hypothetical protein CMJ32_00220 [Phycisphaerae bacterium]|nr:hypothetical protein [Phycisphaerae bacterium]
MLYMRSVPRRARYALMLLACLGLLQGSSASAAILWVDPSGSVTGSYKTIQAAVNAAATSGDIIQVMPGTYVADNPWDTSVINISDKSLIIGSTTANPADVIIDGEGERRCMEISEWSHPASVVVGGMTFVNGSSMYFGGGIHTDMFSSNVFLFDSVIKECSAMFGGGLWLEGGLHLLMGVVIEDNDAAKSGGGIDARYTYLYLYQVDVQDNNSSSFGGGIDCYRSINFLRELNCKGNTSDYGGGLSENSCKSTLYDCVFEHNVSGSGGGINCSRGKMTIHDSAVNFNSAWDTCGGALNARSMELEIDGLEARANTTADWGAVALSESNARITNSSFDSNITNGDAAALSLFRGSLVLTSSSFNNNQGVGSGAVRLFGHLDHGITRVMIDECEFESNVSTGTLSFDGGGAIMLVGNLMATMTQCQFNDNMSSSNGGAIFNSSRVLSTIRWGDFSNNHSLAATSATIDSTRFPGRFRAYGCSHCNDTPGAWTYGVVDLGLNTFLLTCP